MTAIKALQRAMLLLFSLSLSSFPSVQALPTPDNDNGASCQNPAIRKEWGSLTTVERRDYIDAVLCLQQKPSQFPAGEVPGAKSRFDDFAVVHINRTLEIHFNGVFLAWHREFVHLWENALQQECGYSGYQPYWDWPLWQSRGSLASSPLFDGSDTSLGGDGYPDSSYNATNVERRPSEPAIMVAKASGGGCMQSGPFANTTANLGPFSSSDTELPANWTSYNPHCISRDLNDATAVYLNYTYYNATLAADTIADFNTGLNGNLTGATVASADRNGGNFGIHGTGHFVVGTTMFDFFASPLDPAFFLHHGGIDRIWTKWQALDPSGGRTFGNDSVYGTSSLYNANSTPPVTLDTVVWDWGILGSSKTMREMMSTTEGDYCYTYEN